MRADWYVFLCAGAAIAIIVGLFIIAAPILWRERRGRTAAHFTGNPPLEITLTIIPLLIVAALFVYTFIHETQIDHVAAHPENVVDVTAFRWSFRFAYRGSTVETSGTPQQPPTLYLPVGRTTEIDLRSADVNHSFWVPAFLFKRDAIPGMTNAFDLTPTRIGTYVAKCAQFCGLEHAGMSFLVKVVDANAFDRYIDSRGAALP